MMSRRVRARAGSPRSGRRNGFTLIELLVVIAIIGIIASVLMPALTSGREEAFKVQCASNLKNIFTYAMLYSGKKTQAFPIAPGKDPAAHMSLQVLVDYYPDDFKPALFFCPSGDTTEALATEDGKFVLDADTNAYTWVDRRTKNTAKNKALSSDKYIQDYEDQDGLHNGHPKGMNVLSTDGSVDFWDEPQLDPDTKLPPGLVR